MGQNCGMIMVAPGEAAVARWRLASQHLIRPPADSAAGAVRHMLAMQAQDYGQSLWAIGVRSASASAASIEQATAAGEILRTWPMRGTIHWVLPEDARWLLRLCGSRVAGAHDLRLKQLQLTRADIARAGSLLEPSLRQAHSLTRAQCMQVLEDAGLSTEGQRGYTMLWHLAHEELICFGPMDGKQQTFVLLDDWAPLASSRLLEGEEALAELARRYAAARGPVTDRDLAKWAGITLTAARKGIAAADLSTVEINGMAYVAGGEQPPNRRAPDLLLPGFDEYLIGYGDRSAMLAAEHANAIVPGGNGVFRPMIVMDGQITGTWARKVTAKGVTITRTPFVPGGEDTAARLREQAERYATFLGTELISL